MSNIVLAGAAGDLGQRIGAALVRRGAAVSALVRKGASPDRLAAIRSTSATPVEIEFEDATSLREACLGADCVVSALNGLEPTIIGAQGQLLKAAIAAGVPRFMPSDFSLDFTKTRPGDNRNMDLRRTFMTRVDAAPIRATSILNGAFGELLTGEAPIVLHRPRRILCWGNPDQALDFTTKDDVADYAADAALDAQAPRFLRIAGDVVSPRDLTALMSRLEGRRWRTLQPGGIGLLGGLIRITRALSPSTDAPFPAWQGMQYIRDMSSGRGKLMPLDNDRYGKSAWTRVADILAPTI